MEGEGRQFPVIKPFQSFLKGGEDGIGLGVRCVLDVQVREQVLVLLSCGLIDQYQGEVADEESPIILRDEGNVSQVQVKGQIDHGIAGRGVHIDSPVRGDEPLGSVKGVLPRRRCRLRRRRRANVVVLVIQPILVLFGLLERVEVFGNGLHVRLGSVNGASYRSEIAVGDFVAVLFVPVA
jgi:hypothetical protein